MSNRKSGSTRREQRAMRINQVIFLVIGVIVILSMVLSMVAN